MGYFYVSSWGASKAGAKGMTTKEIQKRLKELGQSTGTKERTHKEL